MSVSRDSIYIAHLYLISIVNCLIISKLGRDFIKTLSSQNFDSTRALYVSSTKNNYFPKSIDPGANAVGSSNSSYNDASN